MSDGNDIVPLKLLSKVGSLFAGEVTGRPKAKAVELIKAGKAERLHRPKAQTAAPDEPPVDKAVKATPKAEQREQLAEMAEASEVDVESLTYSQLWAKASDVAAEQGDELESRKGDYLRDYLTDNL